MNSFSKCPQCGLFAERRTSCTCGYVAPADPALARGPASAPPKPAGKPGAVGRVVAVLLVVPIAFCILAVIKWQELGFAAVFDGILPAFVGQVIVGAVGFGLLGLANYLWTGKTGDERKG